MATPSAAPRSSAVTKWTFTVRAGFGIHQKSRAGIENVSGKPIRSFRVSCSRTFWDGARLNNNMF